MCGDGFIRVRMATSDKAGVRKNFVSSLENTPRRKPGGMFPSRPDKYYSTQLRRQYRHISRSLDNLDMQFWSPPSKIGTVASSNKHPAKIASRNVVQPKELVSTTYGINTSHPFSPILFHARAKLS